MVPAAGPPPWGQWACRVAPVYGSSVGCSLAGPSGFGLGLHALRFFGVCGGCPPLEPVTPHCQGPAPPPDHLLCVVLPVLLGCVVWTPAPSLLGWRAPRPGHARVRVVAGPGGPAPWARFGVPHLCLGRFSCPLLSWPPPGWACPCCGLIHRLPPPSGGLSHPLQVCAPRPLPLSPPFSVFVGPWCLGPCLHASAPPGVGCSFRVWCFGPCWRAPLSCPRFLCSSPLLFATLLFFLGGGGRGAVAASAPRRVPPPPPGSSPPPFLFSAPWALAPACFPVPLRFLLSPLLPPPFLLFFPSVPFAGVSLWFFSSLLPSFSSFFCLVFHNGRHQHTTTSTETTQSAHKRHNQHQNNTPSTGTPQPAPTRHNQRPRKATGTKTAPKQHHQPGHGQTGTRTTRPTPKQQSVHQDNTTSTNTTNRHPPNTTSTNTTNGHPPNTTSTNTCHTAPRPEAPGAKTGGGGGQNKRRPQQNAKGPGAGNEQTTNNVEGSEKRRGGGAKHGRATARSQDPRHAGPENKQTGKAGKGHTRGERGGK